jgi:hypothetical protein
MGFGNCVGQRGNETYKLKLTNKNYNYYKLLESDKQVEGPVSTQALVPGGYIWATLFLGDINTRTCPPGWGSLKNWDNKIRS